MMHLLHTPVMLHTSVMRLLQTLGRSRALRRCARVAVSAVTLAAVAAALAAGAAAAIGTDGVELQPQLPRGDDGRFTLAVGHNPRTFEVVLANLVPEAREVRLYTAAATPGNSGAVTVGPAGTVDWLGVETRQLSLAGGEEQRLSFTVDPAGVPAPAPDLVALVVESHRHDTLVTRAANLIRVVPDGAASSLPAQGPLALVALATLAASAAALARWGRDRSPLPATGPGTGPGTGSDTGTASTTRH